MPSSITLTVSNLANSTSFFLGALQPLNYVYRGRVGNTIGFGTPDAPPDFWISQETPGVPAGAAHVAFPAVSQKNVREFFSAALKAGGKVHGEPACRDAVSGYYSAAVIDFDGNSIEAVFRPDLVVDSSDESRPSSMSSVGSVQSKSGTSQKTPTVVSKATTMKSQGPAPSDARSSTASKAPTQASKASSRTPTSVSRAPSQAQSRAATQASQAPSQSSPKTQTSVSAIPDGNTINSFVSEARGAVAVARELANHVRPVLANSTSSPAVIGTGATKDAQSHQPSDTIVGTLLGVAAGAALHYAYSKATKTSPPPDERQQSSRRPVPARTSTDSSLYDTERQIFHRPYAIEPAPSDYSGRTQRQSLRYITMEDHDDRLSDYTKAASTVRPRRRSSFSGLGSTHTAAPSATESRASRTPAGRYIEAPPTSYKAPTAITQAETHTSSRSRSKSRISSAIRAVSASTRQSRPYDSEDDRDTRSRASRRTSKSTRTSRAPSIDARTVVPANTAKPPSRTPSKSSKTSAVTAIRPEAYPLPPSRAGTWAAGSDAGTFYSTHSKSAKTAIGRMVEDDKKREAREAREVSKSVVGKLGDVRRLDLPDEEVRPADSVSQVSSGRTGRGRR